MCLTQVKYQSATVKRSHKGQKKNDEEWTEPKQKFWLRFAGKKYKKMQASKTG